MTTLPADVARCPGDGSFEDGEWEWREGCDDCLRRTAPDGRRTMEPPAIIVFECERRIGPGGRAIAAAPTLTQPARAGKLLSEGIGSGAAADQPPNDKGRSAFVPSPPLA